MTAHPDSDGYIGLVNLLTSGKSLAEARFEPLIIELMDRLLTTKLCKFTTSNEMNHSMVLLALPNGCKWMILSYSILFHKHPFLLRLFTTTRSILLIDVPGVE